MNTTKPIDWYLNEDATKQNQLENFKLKIRKVAVIRLILFLGIIVAITLMLNNALELGASMFPICMIAFLFAVKSSLNLKQEAIKCETAITIIKEEIKAIQGNPINSDTGIDLLQLKHPFAHDLDIFGRKSLWHYLNRTLSPDGRIKLAEVVLNPESELREINIRQEITQELKNHPDFLLQFRVEGICAEKFPLPNAKIENWLYEDLSFLNQAIIKWGRWIFPSITLLIIIGYSISLVPAWALSISIAVNLLVLSRTIKTINTIHNRHSGMSQAIAHHYALTNYCRTQQFNHPLLVVAINSAQESYQAVGQLHRLLNRFDVRLNGFMGILLNTFLLYDYHCLFEIEKWKKTQHLTILKSLHAISTMEYWISLGNFAFQRPDFNFAEITESGEMQADNLYHPLLNSVKHVSNNLSLGKKEQLTLLTGANMTGKSTWLRAIGLNAVIAYIGLPIAATKATFPHMKIYTSMRITDDLDEGISYFKAEISRLQNLLSSIRQSNTKWLVLLDEPLRGTNSGDKQAGTIGLIKNLIKLPTLGVLATHDAALSVLENEYPNLISNYHFDSTVSGYELTFDYTLKSGCSTSNNATILMKLNGILEDDNNL